MRTFARARDRVRDAVPDWWAGAWRWTLLAGGVVAGVYLLLDRAGDGGVVAAVALGALLIGVVVTPSKPLALALMATPALMVSLRLPIGGAGLTVSDAALAAAFVAVAMLGKRGFSPPMRAMLWLNALYQFTTLFTVIVNPYAQNTIEFFHAWLLVSGALVVGWGLGRAGYARTAFALLLGMGALIAIGTVLTGIGQFLRGDFSAVYPVLPWPMHKNFAGTTLAFVAFLAYVNPDWARLPTQWVRPLLLLFLVAIVLTQSRQAMVGLLIILLIYTLRNGSAGHGALITLLAIPAVILVAFTVKDQLESQNKFNSSFQRLDWLREVYALWKLVPVFGRGLRYWYVDPVFPYQPPQAELEVAASSGTVGLIGFVLMWIGMIVVLWRISPRFGMLALGSILMRLVQSQFDLFWISVQVSIPFLIAGICLGAQALHAEQSGDRRYWTAQDRESRARLRLQRRAEFQLSKLPAAYDRLDRSMKG